MSVSNLCSGSWGHYACALETCECACHKPESAPMTSTATPERMTDEVFEGLADAAREGIGDVNANEALTDALTEARRARASESALKAKLEAVTKALEMMHGIALRLGHHCDPICPRAHIQRSGKAD